MSKKNAATNEIGKYSEIKEKLSKACASAGFTYSIQNRSYPFLLTIKPLGGMDAQQTMMEGMEDAGETGYISPDASLVFAYRDGDLTYKISETFTISDKLFNKLKSLFRSLHDMWMQHFYRDMYEHNPGGVPGHINEEYPPLTTTDETWNGDEDGDLDEFADFMDEAVNAEDTDDELPEDAGDEE